MVRFCRSVCPLLEPTAREDEMTTVVDLMLDARAGGVWVCAYMCAVYAVLYSSVPRVCLRVHARLRCHCWSCVHVLFGANVRFVCMPLGACDFFVLGVCSRLPAFLSHGRVTPSIASVVRSLVDLGKKLHHRLLCQDARLFNFVLRLGSWKSLQPDHLARTANVFKSIFKDFHRS